MMNVIFASSEVSPFAKTGGLGDVAEALPIALNASGIRCSVVMPLYGLVKENGYTPKPVKKDIKIKIGGKDMSFDLLSYEFKGTKFYFIKNDRLYKRDGLYGTPKGDHPDNALRFAFFSKAVQASALIIGKPDLFHCHDWQTGLIPLYIRHVPEAARGLDNVKTLYTIHNMAYQGLFTKETMTEIDIPRELYDNGGVQFYGKVSLLRAGILYSDAVSTVSEGYAGEITTKEFGRGMDDIIRSRRGDLYGILNGADYSTWDPGIDKYITNNYNRESLALKEACKESLCKEVGLDYDRERPLIGMITRLAHQKGIDIVVDAMYDMLDLGVNFVILGTGDETYNSMFGKIDKRYPGRAAARVTFDNALAHRIEAGSDMFLMPSRYEPCGLNQMYSMRYATVPVVRSTGGLKDTVLDFDRSAGSGNGFTFDNATSEAMLDAIERAVETFRDKALWRKVQQNGLDCDFSWPVSAKKYVELYRKITGK